MRVQPIAILAFYAQTLVVGHAVEVDPVYRVYAGICTDVNHCSDYALYASACIIRLLAHDVRILHDIYGRPALRSRRHDVTLPLLRGFGDDNTLTIGQLIARPTAHTIAIRIIRLLAHLIDNNTFHLCCRVEVSLVALFARIVLFYFAVGIVRSAQNAFQRVGSAGLIPLIAGEAGAVFLHVIFAVGIN